MAQYYQLKLSGIAGPSNSPLSTASTIADLLASVVRPVPVLVNPLSGFGSSLHPSVERRSDLLNEHSEQANEHLSLRNSQLSCNILSLLRDLRKL